jgi:tripartite-type tricarboxylate transporter receptor subunit TctC
MKKMRLICLKGVFVLAIVFAFTSLSSAAEFPRKSMQWLAPYGVAANSAIGMKIIADAVSKLFPKPVFVVPAKGAGGTLAGGRVAKRVKPDGYTLLLCNSATNGTALYTKKGLEYTNDDFVFLAQYGAFDLGLIAGPESPFKTLEEYVAYARKNPHAIKQASTGVGTSGHLCLELLKIKAGGLKVDMVPYKTAFEQRTAVLGGHCQAAFIYGGGGGPNDEFRKTINGGGRVLAVSSKQRLKSYPKVPTFKEKGIDLVYSAWYGIAGPKDMPKEVTQKLKDAIYKVMEDPQVKKNIEALGFRFEFRKTEEFTPFIKAYCLTVEMIVREAKIPKR